MATNNSGTVNAVLIQNRNSITRNCGFSFCSNWAARGSSDIPHIGQVPDSFRSILGCIGHVHSVFCDALSGVEDSKCNPHLAHDPEFDTRISGCAGQVKSVVLLSRDFSLFSFFFLKYFSDSTWNFIRQFGLQNKNCTFL
jgi:hypothetical protein